MCSILQSDNHQTTSTQGLSLLHLLFETKLTRDIKDLYLQEDEVALLDDEGQMEQITTSNDADNFQDNCDNFGQMETKAEETGMFLKTLHPNVMKQSTSVALFYSTPGSDATQKPSWSPKKTI
jgi:hypothetical protein